MVISYKKLWKLLIDKDLKKKELPDITGISGSSVTKICNALQCDFCDIVELVPSNPQAE